MLMLLPPHQECDYGTPVCVCVRVHRGGVGGAVGVGVGDGDDGVWRWVVWPLVRAL